MKIIASLIAADGGDLSDNVFTLAWLNTLDSKDDAFGLVDNTGGALSNIPPGEYDVESEASIYANNITGNVRSRVTVGGSGVLDGLAGYIQGWGSFVSSARGRITVRAGQTVGLEVFGQAGMKAGYCTTPGVLARIVLTRV